MGSDRLSRLLTIAVNKWERTTSEERRKRFGRVRGLAIGKAIRLAARKEAE